MSLQGMNSKLHLKSVLGGLVAGVLAMLVIGAAFPLNHWGRYQVAGSGAFFVVLDTATGQTWYGDFHATINNPVPSQWSGPDAQSRFFLPKLSPSE